MQRGTTPTHIFTLPFETNLCSQIRVIYAQDGKVMFKRDIDSLELQGNNVIVKLTQQETLSFTTRETIDIQIRVKTLQGDVLASEIFTTRAKRLLEDEVL